MNRLPDVIYLHGLGSSPGSDKARLVIGHLGSLGYRTEAPFLSVPSLVMLSVDAAVATAQRCIKERSAGSSVVLVAVPEVLLAHVEGFVRSIRGDL